MEPLLRHMVDLTGHRDHSMLDLSVISAVQELSNADRTRILGLALVHSHLALMEHAIIDRKLAPHVNANVGEETAPGVSDAADDAAPLNCWQEGLSHGEDLALFPELAHCLEACEPMAERFDEHGHTLWMPVWLKDKANICLEISRAEEFSRQTIQIIAGIISVYRNFQNLLDYSERDALTGLYNRKTFDDQLAKMLANPVPDPAESQLTAEEEERRSFSYSQHWLAVIDVDHFKRINDQFGHVYGDEVLILLSNLMQSSFRSQDRVFRFGGEEFVVLLRSTSLDNARKIIERFRVSVEAYHFPQVGRITVSVGFAAVNSFESPVVILGHADQALYYAKTHGRNLACHYDQLVAQGLLGKLLSNDDVEFF